MSGWRAQNLLVGTPRRMIPQDSASGMALSTPSSTCSTEAFVGAKTATLSPASMQALMAAASTNCVFPVPGAPQTYDASDDRMPSAARLCSSVGRDPSG